MTGAYSTQLRILYHHLTVSERNANALKHAHVLTNTFMVYKYRCIISVCIHMDKCI